MALGAVVPIATSYVASRLKSPTPRVYGKLPGTLVELQEGVEGKVANLNNRTYTDVQTVDLMDSERKSDSGMQGIWTELLPTWSPTPAARAEVLRRDPNFQFRGGTGGAGSSGGVPDPTPEKPAPSGQDRPPLSAASAGGLIGTMPLWLVLGGAAVLGYMAYKAMRKG